MNASLHMDIAAEHVGVRLVRNGPGWFRRTVGKLANTKPAAMAVDTAATDSTEAQPLVTEEIVVYPAQGSHIESPAAITNAAIQVLEALQTNAGALDGCPVHVRIGMPLVSLNLVPLAFSGGATPSGRQLQLIADSVTREAAGTQATTKVVRWQVQRDNEHLCAIALDESLLMGIQALCKAKHLKLASCQPAIMEHLDRALLASARRRDTRTLVWTESDPSGQRLAAVSYFRLAEGSLVNAWRTAVPLTPAGADSDQRLEATTNRFLLASGAVPDEEVILCAWPNLAPANAVAAELQA